MWSIIGIVAFWLVIAGLLDLIRRLYRVSKLMNESVKMNAQSISRLADGMATLSDRCDLLSSRLNV